MSTLLQSKSEIRKRVLAKRDSLSEEERLNNSLVINSSIYKFFLKEFRASATAEKVNSHAMRSDTSQNLKVENNETTFPEFFSKEFRASATAEKVKSHIMRSDTSQNQKVEFTGITIALYDPINTEVDVTALANCLQESGATVLKPLMFDTAGHMEFVPWEEEFDPSGIVPPSTRSLRAGFSPEEIDAIICPVVAFDSKKNRLGYGGGYYDRYLPRLMSDTMKIGVAFACQEVPEIPTCAFDVPLDLVVTERAGMAAMAPQMVAGAGFEPRPRVR